MIRMYDSEARCDTCRRRPDIGRPSYINLNGGSLRSFFIIDGFVASRGALNVDITELLMKLVSYLRFYFIVSSFAPVISAEKPTTSSSL